MTESEKGNNNNKKDDDKKHNVLYIARIYESIVSLQETNPSKFHLGLKNVAFQKYKITQSKVWDKVDT